MEKESYYYFLVRAHYFLVRALSGKRRDKVFAQIAVGWGVWEWPGAPYRVGRLGVA